VAAHKLPKEPVHTGQVADCSIDRVTAPSEVGAEKIDPLQSHQAALADARLPDTENPVCVQQMHPAECVQWPHPLADPPDDLAPFVWMSRQAQIALPP